jgi:hypothetical protein
MSVDMVDDTSDVVAGSLEGKGVGTDVVDVLSDVGNALLELPGGVDVLETVGNELSVVEVDATRLDVEGVTAGVSEKLVVSGMMAELDDALDVALELAVSEENEDEVTVSLTTSEEESEVVDEDRLSGRDVLVTSIDDDEVTADA